jgi:glycosyltransferase involved in cell wall biosynthesis
VSSSPSRLHLVVPGPLEQRTGGYLYDARMVHELRGAGWQVDVHELEGRFPEADETARRTFDATLRGIPEGDTVVVDGLAMGGLPSVVRSHAPRLALVSLVHHPLADETGLGAATSAHLRLLETEALRRVRGVVVTSRFTASRLGSFDVPAERVRAVLPGTDPASPASGPPSGAPPRLLCVGSFSPRKGQDVLVRALERIRDLEWTCVFAGSLERDRPYADVVRNAIGRSGLADRLELLGELDAATLDGAYATASLFVLPSYYEGYGMALAEALARGLPIVSTTGGAIPWTVPRDAGVLVEPGDDRRLAQVLGDLLKDEAERERLAAAARRHAAALPTWTQQAEAFAAAVRELAGRG